MEKGGILPDINTLIGLKSRQTCVDSHCGLELIRVNQEISSNSNATNEGHPTLLWCL